MPGIGSLFREINIKITEITEILESKTDFRTVKPMPAFKVLSTCVASIAYKQPYSKFKQIPFFILYKQQHSSRCLFLNCI